MYLTEVEVSCGVTQEAVQEFLPLVLVRQDRVFLPSTTAPALGTAVARAALDANVEYVGMTLGMPTYQRTLREGE